MAKTVSVALKAHLALEVTTVCIVSSLTRQDGQAFYFADHDADIVLGGHTYLGSVGFSRTAHTHDSNLTVDNTEYVGLFDDDSLTEVDLRSGLFDFAEVRVLLVNWADLTMGSVQMGRCTIGEVRALPSGVFATELRGLTQRYATNVVEVYTADCIADLGDAKCKFNIASLTTSQTVTSVTDTQHFALDTTANALTVDGYFAGGVLSWTSGDNNGRRMEVKASLHAAGDIQLYLPMPRTVHVGDTCAIYPGCDKRIETCFSKFNNVVNFRGFPDIPGPDELTTPNTGSSAAVTASAFGTGGGGSEGGANTSGGNVGGGSGTGGAPEY